MTTQEEKCALVRYYAQQLSNFGMPSYGPFDKEALEMALRIVTVLNELIEERAAA